MAGVRFPALQNFYPLRSVQTVYGAHPASYRMGAGVKRQGPELDHSPPFGAYVKNGRAIFSFPIRLHGVVLN
jgi:hypothetical protein